MTKLFAYFALFCLIGSTFAAVGDDCAENYLTEAFDITVSSTGEVDGDNLPYCQSLKEGTSCCASTEVAKFQAKIEAVVEELESAVIIRDNALNTLRTTTIPALLEDLETLKANAALAATRVAADDTAGTETTPLTTDQATEVITSLAALSDLTQEDLDELKTDLTAFQAARGECFVELLNLQASAYCLACNPTATTELGLGVDGTLAVSADVCTRLTGACYDYVTASASQSAILAVGTINEVIDNLNTALAALGDDEDATGYTKLSEAITANAENEPSDATLTKNAAQPSAVPTGCTDEDCEAFICGVLFSKGEIQPLALVLGGTQVDTLAYTVAPGRLLQTGTWDPPSDEAGVTIEWKNDPANVNSEDDVITLAGAGIIKSGFVCVIALLSLFFL